MSFADGSSSPENAIIIGVGEIAVLRRAHRSANVSAIGRTNLLVLDAHDFRALMACQSQLASRVHAAARHRIGAELVTSYGDLADPEVEERSISVPSLVAVSD